MREGMKGRWNFVVEIESLDTDMWRLMPRFLHLLISPCRPDYSNAQY
jgi:hypothetical protein